ncbi:hypothetical protein QMO56_24675 [Roseomonas sp. E05]|uniref:hypothetical protein n=1 Tax=Roseomonas sp. E05 TaxID=3046310 RepID=UPI0024BB4461|nr:hypothetical protein [Roseomonas sp. E05]MDJ0391308.1 hypothetical protein [Roseomonas sp. E05]
MISEILGFQSDNRPVMGFAWYDSGSFSALREAMPDMSESYDDWRLGAQKDLKKAEQEGYRVIRIAMRPEEFFAWCRQRGIGAPGLSARRAFAADQARLVVQAERSRKKAFSFF